jgi:hypothetical protein
MIGMLEILWRRVTSLFKSRKTAGSREFGAAAPGDGFVPIDAAAIATSRH